MRLRKATNLQLLVSGAGLAAPGFPTGAGDDEQHGERHATARLSDTQHCAICHEPLMLYRWRI